MGERQKVELPNPNSCSPPDDDDDNFRRLEGIPTLPSLALITLVSISVAKCRITAPLVRNGSLRARARLLRRLCIIHRLPLYVSF